MQLSRRHPEITLVFDHLDFRPSAQQCQELRRTLSTVEGVTSVQIHTDWLRRQKLTAVLQDGIAPSVMLRQMAATLRGLRSSASKTYDPTARTIAAEITPRAMDNTHQAPCRTSGLSHHQSVTVRTVETMPTFAERLRQWFYGTLAMASLGMAWVGLLVPGIPTIPFVLLTAHFALKSSPALRKQLLNNRTFGPMMRDWDEHRAIRRSVRNRAYLLTLTLAGITLLLTPPSVVLYAVIVTMSGIGLFLISRIRVLETHVHSHHDQPNRNVIKRDDFN